MILANREIFITPIVSILYKSFCFPQFSGNCNEGENDMQQRITIFDPDPRIIIHNSNLT